MSGRITIVLPQLSAGGTERTAVELANYFEENHVHVTVILLYKKEIFFELNSNIELIEPKWVPKTSFEKPFYFGFLLFYLNTSIRKSRPDSVLLLGYILISLLSIFPNNYNVFFSNRTNPTRSRFGSNKLLTKTYHTLYRLVRNKVNGIIAQTQIVKDYYQLKFSCPISVIPNSLKEMKYFPLIEKEEIALTIGRAVPEKGQKSFVELVAKLKSSDLNLKFLLVGDGPELNNIKAYARELGVFDSIEFSGFQEGVDLYLAKAKYFLLTSITEGYPNVLIEAMAQGCVPISFDCVAGPSDIIDNGENGFLVEVGNINAMAEKITLLANEPRYFELLSQNARKVRETNNRELLNKKWLDFILN